MSGRGVSDIVFVIDSSGSMSPVIDAVKEHVNKFIDSLNSGGQYQWDWRIDFVSHCIGFSSAGKESFDVRSSHFSGKNLLDALYTSSNDRGHLFTNDTSRFKDSLSKVTVGGNETPFIGLDLALDFPWRASSTSHRAIVCLTDEPFEGGYDPDFFDGYVGKMIEKFHKLNVMLFLVAPDCTAYRKLGGINKSEFYRTQMHSSGLSGINFKELMEAIGKSLSVTAMQTKDTGNPMQALFGQDRWPDTSLENLN